MKKIGLFYGMDHSFPEDLIDLINAKKPRGIIAESIKIGPIRMDLPLNYSVILDRVSNEVPFYRSVLKKAIVEGCHVINNPFWNCADDNFFHSVLSGKIDIKIPKTVILPSKDHPPGTSSESFVNLIYPIDWHELFDYVGFPAYIKPNIGISGNNAYKIYNPQEFFAAYDFTGSRVMLLQESIEAEEYLRCIIINKNEVRIIKYDPGKPLHLRYIHDNSMIDLKVKAQIEKLCLKICNALGFEFNSIEIALKDGIPYAVDFLNPVPVIEKAFLMKEDYDWILETSANYLINLAKEGKSDISDYNWTQFLKGANNKPVVKKKPIAVSTKIKSK